MLSGPPTVRIFLGAEPTEMWKGFDSLAHLVDAGQAGDARSPAPGRAGRPGVSLW